MALNAQATLSIIAHEIGANAFARNVRITPVSYALSLTEGTGAMQAQISWNAARTLATTSETLNVAALADNRGGAVATVAFSAVKIFYIRNTHKTLTMNVTSALLSVTPSIGTAALPPGGVLFFSAPSADGRTPANVTVASTATGLTYEIVLIGEGTVT